MFLKGKCTCAFLVVVTKDPNNQIYPVAWALVEGENRSSWTWSMTLLKDNINSANGEGLTIISNQQKVNDQFPDYCLSCNVFAFFNRKFKSLMIHFDLSFDLSLFIYTFCDVI